MIWKGTMKTNKVDIYNKLSKSNLRGNIWEKTGGICWYCGIQTNPWRNFCIDHVIPISSGGDEGDNNLVPCCSKCNSRKRDGNIERLREILSKERSENATFTEYQLEFLKNNGVNIDSLKFEKYLFYYERNKLEDKNVR